MATVRELLDQLATGKLSAAQVAADFRTRTWPKPPVRTEAQRWGTDDVDVPDDNSWQVVEIDPRLTPAQYAVLQKAHASAFERAQAKR